MYMYKFCLRGHSSVGIRIGLPSKSSSLPNLPLVESKVLCTERSDVEVLYICDFNFDREVRSMNTLYSLNSKKPCSDRKYLPHF